MHLSDARKNADLQMINITVCSSNTFNHFSFISVTICRGQDCSHFSFSHFPPRGALASFYKHCVDTHSVQKDSGSPTQAIQKPLESNNLGFFLLQAWFEAPAVVSKVCAGCLWALGLCADHAKPEGLAGAICTAGCGSQAAARDDSHRCRLQHPEHSLPCPCS